MCQELIRGLIGAALRPIPSPLFRLPARPFVAGRSTKDAVAWAKRMQEEKFSVTLDYIGENARDTDAVYCARQMYNLLIDMIGRAGLPADIALKLSHFGIFFRKGSTVACDPALRKYGTEALNRVCANAEAKKIRVWVDAESLEARTLTWEIARALVISPEYLGICIQAFAPDAVPFVKSHVTPGWPGAVRVCKGAAYSGTAKTISESEALAANFISLVETMAGAGCFIQIATHDRRLQFESSAALLGHPCEHALLKGIESQLANHLRKMGKPVRIYAPFGTDIKGYTIRRLQEHPRYFFLPITQFFRRKKTAERIPTSD